MKAIQIRYLPATDTKPPRLKAWTDAGEIIESVNQNIDLTDQCYLLAEQYILDFFERIQITGHGYIQNGDYVATLGE